MNRLVIWAFAALLLLCPTASVHSQAVQADPAEWGIYSQLVGTSGQAGADGYSIRWTWTQPGAEMLQEWIHPKTGKVAHHAVITRGPQKGQLRQQTSMLGNKVWNGTVQPDGSVLFIGEGLIKAPNVVSIDASGDFLMRPVTLAGNRVAAYSDPKAHQRFSRRPGASAQPAGDATPTNPAVPRMVAGSVANTRPAPVTTPAISAAPAAVAAATASPTTSQHGLLERWGVFARLAGSRWALDVNGSMYILSFEWEVPGKVLREEWRPAAALDNLRKISRRHEWNDAEAKIVGNELLGTRFKHEATVASDGSVRLHRTNFISRAAKLSTTFREADGVPTYEETSRGETFSGPLVHLDKERERRFVELAQQAWMARIREENAADDARFDAFQRGLGAVSSALDGAQAEVDARIAAEREQAFVLRQMQIEAQRAAMQEQSRQLRENSQTNQRTSEVAAADRPIAASERSGATAAGAGATIQIKSAPVTKPVREVPQQADPGQREVFVVCQVISLYAGELNPDRRRGALFISAPGRVRLVDGRLPDLKSTYMARIKSQYRRSGPPICESADTREQAEAVIRNFKGGYPHYEHVMTGIDPSA